MRKLWILILLLTSFSSCDKEEGSQEVSRGKELTIFFINDPHSRLTNFSKIKYIVDNAKQEKEVLLVAAGDIFSGSPYVDQYDPKGFPIIDVMNRAGFDVVVIGNHEFDYGLDVLNDRINQSQFDWICANVDTELSELSQPEPFVSMEVGDLRVTFLGLVETNGQPGAVIPATHPWRVADVSFQRYQDMVAEYSNLKEQEGADVLVALTHLGLWDDQLLAANFPFFDLIIGGHSNHLSDESINGIPTLMAGVNLSHLGRVDLVINEGEVTVSDIHMIDLNAYEAYDEELMNVIEEYQNDESFQEVIGTATSYHGRDELGCFYTEALATYMDVDVSFQNGGGIRADLDAGDITTFEIYSIDPFNNGSVIFTKSVREIKDLFIENNLGLHVHGVNMRRVNRDIVMTNLEGNELADEMMLTLGINDYLPAVYPDYFELEDADIQDLTTAETLIEYLRTIEPAVSYEGCDHYFRY